MKVKFYLVRHGQTQGNIDNVAQGTSADLPLTAQGVQDAIKAGLVIKTLVDNPIIISSQLNRAATTAVTIAKICRINPAEIEYDKKLGAVNLGVAGGRPRKETQKLYPQEYTEWYESSKICDKGFDGAETKLDVFSRFKKVLSNKVKNKENDGKNFVISSHGTPIKLFLTAFGRPCKKVKNCELFEIVYDNGKWAYRAVDLSNLVFVNNKYIAKSHLKFDAQRFAKMHRTKSIGY